MPEILIDTGRRISTGFESSLNSNLWIVKVSLVEVVPKSLFSQSRNACLCCDNTLGCKTCSRCKAVQFCSVECQQIVWKNHKGLCELVAKQLSSDSHTYYERVQTMMVWVYWTNIKSCVGMHNKKRLLSGRCVCFLFCVKMVDRGLVKNVIQKHRHLQNILIENMRLSNTLCFLFYCYYHAQFDKCSFKQ